MATFSGKQYDIDRVFITVSGRRLQGFAEGDSAITFTYPQDQGTVTEGADGITCFNANNSTYAECEITLHERSNAHRIMHEVWTASRIAGTAFTFAMSDFGSAESGSSASARVIAAPPPSKGKGASARTWKLSLPGFRVGLVGPLLNTL